MGKRELAADRLYENGSYVLFGDFCTGGIRKLNQSQYERLLALIPSDENIVEKTKRNAELIDAIGHHRGNDLILSDDGVEAVKSILQHGCPVLDISHDEISAIETALHRTIEQQELLKTYEFRRRVASRHIAQSHIRKRIFDRDGNKCLRCGRQDQLSIDHIVSIKQGGWDSDDNLQTLCVFCNSSKGGK